MKNAVFVRNIISDCLAVWISFGFQVWMGNWKKRILEVKYTDVQNVVSYQVGFKDMSCYSSNQSGSESESFWRHFEKPVSFYTGIFGELFPHYIIHKITFNFSWDRQPKKTGGYNYGGCHYGKRGWVDGFCRVDITIVFYHKSGKLDSICSFCQSFSSNLSLV